MMTPVKFHARESLNGVQFYIFPEHVMAVIHGVSRNSPEEPQTMIVLTGGLSYVVLMSAEEAAVRIMGTR